MLGVARRQPCIQGAQRMQIQIHPVQVALQTVLPGVAVYSLYSGCMDGVNASVKIFSQNCYTGLTAEVEMARLLCNTRGGQHTIQ